MGDVYTPELKVKHFLDSLAYFLLLGNTDGIETIYKRFIHAKREIPASNCPSDIDNLMYASGQLSGDYAKEEHDAFREMCEMLDERAEPYEVKRKPTKTTNLYEKKLKKGIHGGSWHQVDTEGKFWVGNNHYIISDQAVQYQPVSTKYGDYYAMDRILASGGKFYDMNYDEVEVFPIGGLVPYGILVGTET